jgi:hypothetical protein
MMTARTMVMAHPVKIFASNDNDDTLPAVALKKKELTNNKNQRKNIYVVDGIVVNDPKSIFMLGLV